MEVGGRPTEAAMTTTSAEGAGGATGPGAAVPEVALGAAAQGVRAAGARTVRQEAAAVVAALLPVPGPGLVPTTTVPAALPADLTLLSKPRNGGKMKNGRDHQE